MGKKILRFVVHILECFVRAKEVHSSLLEWLPLLAFVFVLASGFWGLVGGSFLPTNSTSEWFQEERWKICGWGCFAWIALAFWNSFWMFAEKEDALKEIENETINLELAFIGPPDMQPESLEWDFKVSVSHNRQGRLAGNVRVAIASIDCPEWADGRRPRELNVITWPHYLPNEGSEVTSESCDVHPLPSRQVFDMLVSLSPLKNDPAGMGIYLGLAPYRKRRFPATAHSLIAEFLAVPLMADSGRTFTITIHVTFDRGILVRTAELYLPAFSEMSPRPRIVMLPSSTLGG